MSMLLAVTDEGIERELERLRSIPDPEERAKAAQDLAVRAKQLRREIAVARFEAVNELRQTRDDEHPDGWSHAEVGRLLGVERGTAQYIAEGRGLGRDASESAS
jgi:hypothetical protein